MLSSRDFGEEKEDKKRLRNLALFRERCALTRHMSCISSTLSHPSTALRIIFLTRLAFLRRLLLASPLRPARCGFGARGPRVEEYESSSANEARRSIVIVVYHKEKCGRFSNATPPQFFRQLASLSSMYYHFRAALPVDLYNLRH